MKVYIVTNPDKTIAMMATYELPDSICVELEDSQYKNISEHLHLYKYINEEFVLQPTTEYQTLIQLDNYRIEMDSIQEWLAANDYRVNKFLLGEYTENDERWISYKSERAVKLARYNELETLINGSN